MKEETGYFSSFDRTRLFFRAWEKDSEDALVIIHGFGEHSGRYLGLVEVLGSLPISIYLFDLRGHGRSEGERVYVRSFDDLIRDVYEFRAFLEAKRAALALRFNLLGQSLGGLLAVGAALEKQSAWQTLILLSPYFGVFAGNGFLFTLSSLVNLIAPKGIWRNPIKPIFLTHDTEEIAQYKRDPHVQRMITNHMAYEMFRGSSLIEGRASELVLPILILASACDRIVSLRKIKLFFEQVKSTEKSIHVVDGAYHELLHEVDRAKWMEVIKTYLTMHSSHRDLH